MKGKGFSLLILVLMLSACVPQRKYQELETRYNDLDKKKKECDENLGLTTRQRDSLKNEAQTLLEKVSKLRTDSLEMHNLFHSNKKLYDELKDSYEKLLKNNQLEEAKLLSSLKELEEKLKEREKDLLQKEANLKENTRQNEKLAGELQTMKADLEAQQKKVKDLQAVLDAKDSAVNQLKNTLSKALLGFKDKGLSVEIRNGKVYVSMDEKLLFASASIVVDSKGKEALLQLAKTIQGMEDITIMVEGHTDDVPISSGQIKDNWDLSVLRATSIVRILTKDGKVDPHRFVAAGRGEFFPVDPSKSPEARAKNRRTEIIISPKLDEILKILESN